MYVCTNVLVGWTLTLRCLYVAYISKRDHLPGGRLFLVFLRLIARSDSNPSGPNKS